MIVERVNTTEYLPAYQSTAHCNYVYRITSTLCFLEREGSEEEVEFLQKLDYLRTQAQVFLRMLNDMRRRLKELPPDAAAAKQYRLVDEIVA